MADMHRDSRGDNNIGGAKMLIYLAGPYIGQTRNETVSNIAKARCIAHDCWKAGFPTICPHMNTEGFDDLPSELFYIGDLEIMERCDAVLMLPGWMDSFGAKLEHITAKRINKPIYYSLKELQEKWPQ